MKHHQGLTPHTNHPATTPNSAVPRSPPHGKPRPKVVQVETSAFDNLLITDEAFFRRESRQLARRAARLGVPPSDIADVVAEVWRDAVKHRQELADAVSQGWLHFWLMRVLDSKAADALSYLAQHRCEVLGTGEEEPIDEAEVKRSEAMEEREWLSVLLARIGPGNEEGLCWLCAHVCQGYSLRDLAEQSGLKRCAVEGRIRRVRKKLHDLAEQQAGRTP